MAFEINDIHIKNLNAFLEELPEELGILFFKMLATKRPDDFQEVSEKLHAFMKISDKIVELMMA
jgi:hypothetical protein